MGVRYYDDAIYNKIQKWIKDPHMVILKPNEVSRLWQIRADQKNDEPLTLPLIAISRDPRISIDVKTKRHLTFDGKKIDNNDIENTSVQLDGIPIQIHYQLDVYTQRYDEGDEYMRNFVYNLINYPKMTIEIPYNGAKIEHVCYINLDDNFFDNSDVQEKLFPDEFTRWSILFTINDAYLFSIPVKENARVIGAQLKIIDDDRKTEEKETVILTDSERPIEIVENDSTGEKDG